jgi:hypothetical protein
VTSNEVRPLNPYYVPEHLRQQAQEYFDKRDPLGFLYSTANSCAHLDLVFDNVDQLKAAGMFEAALTDAIIETRGNNRRHSMADLRRLFKQADIAKLREVSPLPGPGPFTLYRGVSGKPRERRVRGLSWTSDRAKAEWFANRFPGVLDPAVYVATVPAEYVMGYSNDRSEHEFFVLLPPSIVPRRVRP